MAYLDKIVSGVEKEVFKFSSRKTFFGKSKLSYTTNILAKIENLSLFSEIENRNLATLLPDKPLKLSPDQEHDLLNISRTGKERMLTYIRQFVLVPPKEVPQPRKRNKLKCFTKTRVTKRPWTTAIRLKYNLTPLTLSCWMLVISQYHSLNPQLAR